MRKFLLLFTLLPSFVLAQGPVDSSGRPYVNATDGAGAFNVIVDSGTLTCNAGTGTLAVSGPLTDTELRATPVPVSGTFWQATQPVSGTLTCNAGSGTLAVSAAALPLPSGAATSALQDGIVKDGAGDTTQANVSGGRLHVDGSGVTQPVSGTVTANAGTGTMAVSGPLTDTQLRATAVPVSGTFWQATQPVSGTVSATQSGTWTINNASFADVATTTGGTLISRTVSAASTNATNVKASFGQVYQIVASNVNAAARFVHLYNTSGTPTCNASIITTFILPGNSTGAGTNITLAPGATFGTGIGFCITTANDGTGSVSAGDVVLNLFYK